MCVCEAYAHDVKIGLFLWKGRWVEGMQGCDASHITLRPVIRKAPINQLTANNEERRAASPLFIPFEPLTTMRILGLTLNEGHC